MLVSDSVEGMSLSFSVLDRFLRLLVSVSVDCEVGVGRAFILDAEAELGWNAFPGALSIAMMLFIV